jgi:hypothetical protein
MLCVDEASDHQLKLSNLDNGPRFELITILYSRHVTYLAFGQAGLLLQRQADHWVQIGVLGEPLESSDAANSVKNEGNPPPARFPL